VHPGDEFGAEAGDGGVAAEPDSGGGEQDYGEESEDSAAFRGGQGITRLSGVDPSLRFALAQDDRRGAES
jgi:hypothetical protein